jgi:hypothetical protein
MATWGPAHLRWLADVVCPGIRAGIEEPDEGPRALHDRPNVAAFCAIAEGTRVRQVVSLCLSAVLFTDDVIHFTAEEGIFLMDQAIFAEGVCPYRHEPAQGRINVAAHGPDGHRHGL